MAYTDTITSFKKIVGPGGSLDPFAMTNLFVKDAPAPPGPAYVGLTTRVGPVFTGQKNINELFAHLFDVFPNMVFQLNTQQLVYGNMMAIEALLTTGNQKAGKPWAPLGNTSAPISNVVPDGAHGATNFPVCAVFTFDDVTPSDLIKNLALYFDRWALAMALWDGKLPPNFHP